MKRKNILRTMAALLLGTGQTTNRIPVYRHQTGAGVARARLAPTRAKEKARRVRQMEKGMLPRPSNQQQVAA